MAPNIIYAPFICMQLLLCHSLPVQFSNVVVASASTDTITEGQTLGLPQTLTSSGQVFELGFFSPQNSTNFYLGIWYKKVGPGTVVWVGNRDQPLTSSSPYLTLEQGNLVIIDDRITYRVSSVSSARDMSLVLLDSGNLVLIDRNSLDVIWQSFDDPTDTFLPGMKLGIDKRTGKVWSLTAWEKENDPTPGTASLKLNPQRFDEFIILKGNETYWSSGSWNGKIFQNMPGMESNHMYKFSFNINEDISYLTYSLRNTSILCWVVLDISGQLREFVWLDDTKQWNMFAAVPRINCDVYSFCGPFSSCNNAAGCQCLKGFRPSDSKSWEQGRTSGGCVRKVPLQCEESSSVEGEKDGFSMMQEVVAPLNPNITYASREECKSICQRDCSCNAYTYNSSGGCFLWSGDLLNLKQPDKGDPSGGQLYLKLAAFELRDNRGSKSSIVKITLPATSPFLLLLVATFVYCLWKKRQKIEEATEDMQFFSVDMMGILVQVSGHSTDQANEIARSKDPQLPQFSFKSVSASTDDFSLENKLGEGGFGPVYKGKLLNGQEVAVKRLSRKSGQGLRELRNETTLIAKLQHMNLVRILGCCLEKDEKILIYELMANGSLDSFLFNPSKRGLLCWKVRAGIIEGIAQGLLYLHEHSRLRIIHRDLKASNILLDKDMNPKISDFGLAKLFGRNESQAKTFHIVGTYGYMSPEYALEGLCSTKSDVFSFGVLLLEIISGKKNTGFYQSNSLNLLSYAWELWIGGMALQLVDPVLEDRCSDETMMRYINIAFLCVHEIAAERPTMSEVVSMLVNENLALPSPKQPAFSYLLGATTARVQPVSSMQPCSRNDVTISAMEAR